MGWHLYSYPIQTAVHEGIVQRINLKSGRNESDGAFLTRLRAECIDEDQWLQEYCCIPADSSSSFITHELLDACEDRHLELITFDALLSSSCSSSSFSGTSRSTLDAPHPLFLGMDVARKHNLCVIDVGQKIDGVVRDLLRIELLDAPFSQMEFELHRLLQLPQLQRAAIDATGMGMQLAEQARQRFGWKVEALTLTAPLKEELAFALRRDFEDRRVRIPRDEKLRADLRAIKKHVTASGNLRFLGETDDSHCDRFWAKALRQHVTRHKAYRLAATD
jgi:phage FluMu gp28-like protein